MDYRTDLNPKGIQFLLSQLGDRAPNYVTAKEAGDTANPKKFALPGKDEYPYDTPKHTWMSYAYLKTASHGLSQSGAEFAERRLKLAAATHRIEDDICEIDMLLSTCKEAFESAPKKKYALTIKKAGETRNVYPINNKTQVRNSIAHLNNAVSLPIEWKKQACLTVVDAANEFGISRDEIPDKILQLGVRREPNFKKAASVAEDRARKVEDPEVAQLYKDIVKGAAHDDEANLDKYVELMVDLDRASGFKDYGPRVIDPYSAFYSGLESSMVEKVARENVYLMDTLIPTEAINNIRGHMHVVFSKKAAAALTTLIEDCDDGMALSQKLGELPLETQKQIIDLAVKKG